MTAFTGRTGELAELDLLMLAVAQPTGRLQDRAAVVIAVVTGGTAGVGKTALALQWAHQVAGRFPDGQLYVNLRGYDPDRPVTAAEALAGFLRSLGLAGAGHPRRRRRTRRRATAACSRASEC